MSIIFKYHNYTSSSGTSQVCRLVFLLSCSIVIDSVSSWFVASQTRIKHAERFMTRVDDATKGVSGVAAAGLHQDELKTLRQALNSACSDQLVQFSLDNDIMTFPSACEKIPGSTGRVLLFEARNMPEEEMENLKLAMSYEIDELIYAQPPLLSQPVIIAIQEHVLSSPKDCQTYLQQLVAQHVQIYELISPFARRAKHDIVTRVPPPTSIVEVDGAMVTSTTGEQFWDTSSILVFDNFVKDDLRKRILQVLNKDGDWDDVNNGPDPTRWVRGGLVDLPDQEQEDNSNACYGLTDDAIDDLCLHHDAFEEFETIVSDTFPDFTVCRLPEAVLGSTVSPLTANAPTNGDSFSYHIDADPYLTPPSPWTDVFGRYPNRQVEKPRFISLLIYLNNEWKGEVWGAPTRFLDVNSDTHYDVLPIPGRCVFMDQDITHTVVAPTKEAGKNPRYSLVWKLILHPKSHKQDMKQLRSDADAQWPAPILLGSAKNIRQS